MATLAMSLWRIVLLAVVLLAGYGIGAALLRLTGLDRQPAIAKATPLLSVTLGLGVLSYSVLAIGLLGGLYWPVIWGLLIAFWAAGLWATRGIAMRSLVTGLRRAAIAITGLNWPYRLLLGFIVLFVLLNLIGTLAPPLGIDDLKYHFAIPKRYVSAGAIRYLPDYGYSNLPFTMEMLWTLAMVINSGELAQLINWSIGLLVLGWIVLLGRYAKLDASLIVVAGVLFYTITSVGYQSRSGSVELGGTLFFLASVYILLVRRPGEECRSLLLAGVLAGLYAGTKLPNAAMVVLLTLWVTTSSWRVSHSVRDGLASGIVFGLAALAVAGIWYIKAFVMTGNPVYPFLRPIFGGPPIHWNLLPATEDTGVTLGLSQLLLPSSPNEYLERLWLLIANPQRLRAHVSPLFLGLLPVVLGNVRRMERELRWLVVIASLVFLYWVSVDVALRYGLPLFALLALPSAWALGRIIHNGMAARFIVSAALVAWLLTSLAGHLREVLPAMPVVLGSKPRTGYIAEWGSTRFAFHNQSAFAFMNEHLPPEATVLLWSNDGYYLDRPYFYAIEFITVMANGQRLYDPEQVMSELKRFGITHVAMTDNYLRRLLRDTLEATGQLDCIYEDSNMVVCALPQATPGSAEGTER